MSLLLIEGFNDSAATNSKGWVGGAFVPAGGRFSAGASALMGNNVTLTSPLVANTGTLVVGFAWNVLAWPTSADEFIQFFGGATQHITCLMTTAGEIQIRRGTNSGTILLTTAPVSTGWHYFEFKLVIADSGGSVVIHLDGAPFADTGSTDTKNAGSTTFIDSVVWVGMGGSSVQITDVYMLNTSGSAPLNDFLGDVRVNTLYPDTEATPTDFTPSTGSDNSDVIDETGNPNTTDYNSSDTPGQIDMFNLTALPDATAEIFGVQVNTYFAKDDVATIQVRSRVDSDSNVETSSDHAAAVSYAFAKDLYPLDPDGDVQWTGAQVDAATFGYEARA